MKKGRYGAGRLYQQPGCKTWSYKLPNPSGGKPIRGSTGETDLAAAKQFLNMKLGDIARGGYVEPDRSRTTVADLFALVERNFMLKGRKSLKHEQQRWA